MSRKFDIQTRRGERRGVTAEQLHLLVDEGILTPNDLVRAAGTKRWSRADAWEGLFPDERLKLDDDHPVDPPTKPRTQRANPKSPQSDPKRKKPRTVLMLMLLLVPLGTSVFVPSISLWLGLGLLLLVMLFVFPRARPVLSRVFRVSADRPVRRVFKLTMTCVFALSLLVLSWTGSTLREELERAKAARLAQEAEERQLVEDANAEVAELVAAARTFLDADDIDKASEQLEAAIRVDMATNHRSAKTLLRNISASGDESAIYQTLVNLPQGSFNALQDSGRVPKVLEFGHDTLTSRALALARPQLERAAARRTELANKRAAAAIAARERKAKQREEALRREAAERERARLAEEERKTRTAQEVQNLVDAYVAVLQAADVKVVTRVTARRIGSRTLEATLHVSNFWHIRHKQIRLQDAQALWEAWAALASPEEPDLARIRIVDQRGNEVGGSRVWGGSLIWVKDD